MSTKVKSPDDLPLKPGIYLMKDKDENIIYIGKSKSLKKRVKSYFKDKHDSPKTKILMSRFNSLEYIVTDSEKEALILEANLIKKHKPKYNIRLKDDKRYPYVKITNEKFPRVIITRNIGKDGLYYGPFTDVGSVRQTVKFLKELFKIRTCKRMDGPCLNNQIDLCYGPCTDGISSTKYNEIINKIDLFFNGKYSEITNNLQKEMENAALNQEYEKAGVLRDQINSIKEIMEKQFVDFKNDLDQDIIAISKDKDSSIVVVFSIRNGKIIGKDDYLMYGTENQKESGIISAFIQQYYGTSRHVPQEILIGEKIEEVELISEWLSDLRSEELKLIAIKKDGDKDEGVKVKIKVAMDGVELRLLRMAAKNADIIKKQKKKLKNAMIELKKHLKLEKIPRRIEGFDVSNISGKLAVGSKVSFYDSKPDKSQYRRFKLKTPGPDDYGMMKELVSRRLKSLVEKESVNNIDSNSLEPDLILIDGGKGHLGVAKEVLDSYGLSHIPIISLAEEFEEIFIPQSSFPIIMPHSNEGLQLLQRVRDESHRFALTYHRQLRSENLEYSELDDIKGVGKTRKTNLLKHFGDLESVKKASVDALIEVKGMNKAVAQNIYDAFHD